MYSSDLSEIVGEDERLGQLLDLLVPERISLSQFPPGLLDQIPPATQAELERYRHAEEERLREETRIILNIYHEYQGIRDGPGTLILEQNGNYV